MKRVVCALAMLVAAVSAQAGVTMSVSVTKDAEGRNPAEFPAVSKGVVVRTIRLHGGPRPDSEFAKSLWEKNGFSYSDAKDESGIHSSAILRVITFDVIANQGGKKTRVAFGDLQNLDFLVPAALQPGSLTPDAEGRPGRDIFSLDAGILHEAGKMTGSHSGAVVVNVVANLLSTVFGGDDLPPEGVVLFKAGLANSERKLIAVISIAAASDTETTADELFGAVLAKVADMLKNGYSPASAKTAAAGE